MRSSAVKSYCREGSAATTCTWISVGILWINLCSFNISFFVCLLKVITLASTGSATIVGKQNQLVQMGTSWRGQWPCGFQMSGLFRNIGTHGVGLTVKANLPGMRTWKGYSLCMIICTRTTHAIRWLIKEQVFSKPRVLLTAFLIRQRSLEV